MKKINVREAFMERILRYEVIGDSYEVVVKHLNSETLDIVLDILPKDVEIKKYNLKEDIIEILEDEATGNVLTLHKGNRFIFLVLDR